MDLFWTAPPVARTLTALTFIQSILIHGGIIRYLHVLLLPKFIFRFPPQLWRLFTPFLLTGPGLSFVLDLYFMYTYGSALETGSPRFSSPGDFLTYVFFVGTVIMAWWENLKIARVMKMFTRVLTAGFLLNGVILTSALILAFIYTYAQDNRGRRVTFIIIQIPVEFLPWATLVLTLVLAGWPSALIESMGIIAAHLYDFLTRLYPTFGGGRNYITTPGFVRRLFVTSARGGEYRTYGTAYRSSAQPRDSSSSGWTSSLQNPWSSRGAGRRLGG